MISGFLSIQQLFSNKEIKMKNEKLNKIIQNYAFIHFSDQNDIDSNILIYQNISKSNIVMINQCRSKNQVQETYIIVGFYKTIVVLEKSQFLFFQSFFSSSNSQNLNFYFLKDIDDFNLDKKNIFYAKEEICFIDEIESFNNELSIYSSNKKEIKQIWEFIKPCISGYLIKQSYQKTKNDRLKNFNLNENSTIINENEFIELRFLGRGSVFITKLIYHIEKEELYALKKPHSNDVENSKLIQREIDNYLKIQHPFLPKFMGTNKSKDYIVIEFVNGRTLYGINKKELKDNEKYTIIFEIMIIIEFLHRNHFIFRDLKPDNLMVDFNNTIILIDLDRMVEFKNISNAFTCEFSSLYVAPEVNFHNYSYECDIYSLGLVIFYIIEFKNPTLNNLDNFLKLEYLNEIKKIIIQCTKNDPKERPTIIEILLKFYITYRSKIRLNIITLYNIIKKYFNKIYDVRKLFDIIKCFKDPNDCHLFFHLGYYYIEGEIIPFNISKAIYFFSIAAKQNLPDAQYFLGLLYINYNEVERDINKAIHYFTLASDNNLPDAQYALGIIYLHGKDINQDINKGIHYIALAADQNHCEALLVMGIIYLEGKFLPFNINKAIHYLSLAANNNISEAQYNLALIYSEDKFVVRDIKKAIYYYTLAANQNYVYAQLNLALIYYQGEFIDRDIKKAIYYYTLAANQNNLEAQFNLGVIYSNDEFLEYDINKAIYYFKLLANQNYTKPQIILGNFYESDKYFKPDYDKAIYYYSLAANKNDPIGQFFLGHIYERRELKIYDIRKSIYYYTLAANQNLAYAQFNLGIIYYDGELIERDIKKAIYYFTLASDQNLVDAQLYLGIIYGYNELIDHDVKKSIHYFTLAANQNDAEAQFNLGSIYSYRKFNEYNINKAIYFYTLAAKQNHCSAQFDLGIIYISGLIPRDDKKAYYYLKLAADQNHSEAQFVLGYLYGNSNIIPCDIDKSIHYYQLAANQNHVKAQFNLGVLYANNEFTGHDNNKSIYYLTLAANQKFPDALLYLGLIYEKGTIINKNDEKAIYYYTRAAYANQKNAQRYLGLLYFYGVMVDKDQNKGVDFILQSANNGHIESQFTIGYLYHVGMYFNQDINKSICYYKQASSFNNTKAKNNLGIIYKHENKIGWSIEYFKESIHKGNDYISMYNLAHLYFYEKPVKNSIEKSIKLFIKSSLFNIDFYPSKIMLCLASIQQFGKQIDYIIKGLNRYEFISNELLNSIVKIIKSKNLFEPTNFEKKIKDYHDIDYIYDFFFISSSI